MPLRVSCPDFVGRVEELALLGSALHRAAQGHAAAVLIGGDAGIGKSRLVEEFSARARAEGALVASGGCVLVDGEGLPYAPIAGVVRDVVHQLGPSGAAEMLGPLASGLGSELGVPGLGDPSDGYSAVPHIADELVRTRLFESILACMRALAERSVVVFVFEDLHWADSGSAGLVSFLTRNLSDARVLLVGTYRTDDLGRDQQMRTWLSELGRQGGVTPLGLEALARDETAQMIGGIIGRPPDWALVEAVWARSQGNAFFTEELTASRHSPTLSPELQGVIMSRVEGLSPDAQLLLQVAATAGSTIDHELVSAVGVLEADDLDAALAETVDLQILVVDSNRAGYRFRHALLREAVYDALLPGQRRRLHRQLATTLTLDAGVGERDPGHRAAELAAHWWASGEWSAALDASLSAADAAVGVWAFPEALAHLERALSALDRMSETERPDLDRLRLLESAADAAYLAGDGQRAVDLARAAIDTVDADDDPATAARLYALLGRNAWGLGDSGAAFEAYRQAAALVPADRPSVELARVLAEEARGLMLMSRMGESERRCHDAMAVALAVGARTEEGHIRYTLGCCRASLGFHEEGITLVRESLAIAEEVGSADDLNRAYMGLSSLLVGSGRLEEGAALVFDSVAKGEELWGVRLNGAAGNSTEALIRLGRLDEAEALVAQTDDRGVGSCTGGPILRAMITIRCGRFDEAVPALAATDEVTNGLADLQHRGVYHLQAAEFALLQRRPQDAYDEIERVLAIAAGTDDERFRPEIYAMAVRTLADLVEAARLDGRRFDADKARLLARGFVQEAEDIVAAPAERGGRCGPRVEALTLQCVAEESRLHQPAPDLWVAASRCWDHVGEPYPAAYCRWREAEALLEGGADRGRAEACIQDSWRVSVELRARPLQERIERLAQRARVPLIDLDGMDANQGATVGSDLGLTPREVEVLAQLAAGRRDGEIAKSLFISKKTVSVHVSNVLRKLDVSNRVEAGRIGQDHGLG